MIDLREFRNAVSHARCIETLQDCGKSGITQDEINEAWRIANELGTEIAKKYAELEFEFRARGHEIEMANETIERLKNECARLNALCDSNHKAYVEAVTR